MFKGMFDSMNKALEDVKGAMTPSDEWLAKEEEKMSKMEEKQARINALQQRHENLHKSGNSSTKGSSTGSKVTTNAGPGYPQPTGAYPGSGSEGKGYPHPTGTCTETKSKCTEHWQTTGTYPGSTPTATGYPNPSVTPGSAVYPDVTGAGDSDSYPGGQKYPYPAGTYPGSTPSTQPYPRPAGTYPGSTPSTQPYPRPAGTYPDTGYHGEQYQHPQYPGNAPYPAAQAPRGAPYTGNTTYPSEHYPSGNPYPATVPYPANQYPGNTQYPATVQSVVKEYNNEKVPFEETISGGLYPGRRFQICGTAKWAAWRFGIKFQCGPTREDPEVGFGFDVRIKSGFDKNVLVRNNRLGGKFGKWGKEERNTPLFPFAAEKYFAITIIVEPQCFRVLEGDSFLCTFDHRLRPLERMNTLRIEGDIEKLAWMKFS